MSPYTSFPQIRAMEPEDPSRVVVAVFLIRLLPDGRKSMITPCGRSTERLEERIPIRLSSWNWRATGYQPNDSKRVVALLGAHFCSRTTHSAMNLLPTGSESSQVR